MNETKILKIKSVILGGLVGCLAALTYFALFVFLKRFLPNSNTHQIIQVLIVILFIRAIYRLKMNAKNRELDPLKKAQKAYDSVRRAVVVNFGILIVLLGSLFAGGVHSSLFLDRETNSGNIYAHLQSDPTHPFIGFWKVSCQDNCGVAIEKGEGTDYHERFCGPGGCFQKNLFPPISLDAKSTPFRVLDSNTIEFKKTGKFSLFGGNTLLQNHKDDDTLIFHKCSDNSTRSSASVPKMTITYAVATKPQFITSNFNKEPFSTDETWRADGAPWNTEKAQKICRDQCFTLRFYENRDHQLWMSAFYQPARVADLGTGGYRQL